MSFSSSNSTFVVLRNRKMVSRNDPAYQTALARIEECFSILNSKTGLNLAVPTSDPLIFFSGSRTGGYVNPSKHGNRVFLNWVLFKENEENYLKVVIPHEVAHLYQRAVNKMESSHGPTWKRMMNMIGLPAVRCHQMDTSNASRGRMSRNFELVCSCMTHKVTANIFNKVVNGQRRTCKRCRTVVKTPAQLERDKIQLI
jgi:predicted SprT family Zn-dependent metalloprotease